MTTSSNQQQDVEDQPPSIKSINQPTALIDLSNSTTIPPCFSTIKLLSESHDHQNHSELWPHPIWDLEFNSHSATWNPIIQANQTHQPIDHNNNNNKSNLSSSPSQSNSSKYPPTSTQELVLSKPHPSSFFCPIEWRWLTIEILDSVTPPRVLDSKCNSQELDCPHHFFQSIKSSIHQVHAFNPIPTSIFNVLQSDLPVDSNFTKNSLNEYDYSIKWDARICPGCQRGIFISPPEATVPSVFDRQYALDLIAHAKRYNLLPAHAQSKIRPEQYVYKAWHTVFIVIQNALAEGKISPLPLNGKSISGRMPWDPISAKIWACLGVTRKEGMSSEEITKTDSKNSVKHSTGPSNSNPLLVLPCLNVKTAEGRKNRALWCRALLEVSVFLKWYKLQHPHVEESVKPNYIVPFNLVSALPKILHMLGGNSIPSSLAKTAWQTPNGKPVAYQAYSTLGIIPAVSDDIVILAYKVQVKAFPNLRFEFFEALREIKTIRDSETLEFFLGLECSRGVVGAMEAREAWALICSDANGNVEPMDLTREDFMMESFNLKNEAAGSDQAQKAKLREALRILVEASPTHDLLRAILDSANTAAEEKSNPMDLNKAYATLGDVVPEVDDEILWMAYTIGVADQPGQKDALRAALQVIATHRKSQLIESRLVNEMSGGTATRSMDIIPCSPPPISYELPAGLNNIGNTCYLNSLLQYFFSVRELRETLLQFPEFEQDTDEHEIKEKKRVGGRIVSTSEILRSKQFASKLQGLFREMMTTSSSAVTPERELAFLALVLSKDESPISAQNNNNHNSSASTDATLVDDRSGIIGPTYNPTPSPPALATCTSSSTVLGKRKSESSGSEDGHSGGRNMMEVDSSVSAEEKDVVGGEEDLVMGGTTPAVTSEPEAAKAAPLVIDLTDETNVPPPPLPPRPNRSRSIAVVDSGSHMMFGRQNDVSECMDNCLFQIQAALDEQKVLASGNFDGDGNLVKSLFYGKTRQSLVFDNPQGKVSVKEEQFAYLLVDVAEEGRDLYDGLDKVFDESEVELENGKACRRVGLVELPPILQIQLQRVQFDRRTHTVFKSNAHLKFDERLRMNRYLEPDSDDLPAQEKRSKTIKLRKEIECLRGRLGELTTDVSGDKRTASTILRDLHKILSSSDTNNRGAGNSTNRMEFFDGLIGSVELSYLESEAAAIDEEIENNKTKVQKLKTEVEEMWKAENDSSNDSKAGSSSNTGAQIVVEPNQTAPQDHQPQASPKDKDKSDNCKLGSAADLVKDNFSEKKQSPKSAEYMLVSLFMHRGTAQGGHYWAIQRQLPDKPHRWLKYNDSQVTEVDPKIEIFKHPDPRPSPTTTATVSTVNPTSNNPYSDSAGCGTSNTANPYWLTYVRVGDEHRFQMLCRERPSPS